MQRRIDGFDWSRSGHIAERDIEEYEIEYVVLFDKPYWMKSRSETYCVFGVTENGRYLFVVLAINDCHIAKMITAREMTKKEKRFYKER